MNMEDRLKEAFEQEASRLNAPAGSPETAIRRGRRRRASNLIGGAALVFALVGGTAAGIQLLGTSEDPVPEDLASSNETSQTVDESTIVSSNAEVADFLWEQATLPKPENTEVWNVQVAAGSDGFVAVGTGYTPTVDEAGERILVWHSQDGSDWSLTTTSSPFTGSVDNLLNTGDGFVAVVRTYDSFDGSTDSTSLYSPADGLTWTEGDADLGSIANNQYMWFAGAATGNGTTVLAGSLQTEPDQPPVVFEEAGVVLQENPYDGGFTVSDLATGETITVLSNQDVYGGGPVVYGPDGDVIVALSQEDVEGAFTGESDGKISVEQDGIRVDFNFNEGTYVATDIASGAVITEGDENDLYRIPHIVVVDPNTNETILDIDLDEFYRAQDDAWNDYDSDYRPETELIILTTSDGATWDRIELPISDSEEVNVSGVGYGPDGFLFTANSYGGDRFGQDVWRSADGRNWELVASSEEPGDGPIVSGADAYFRLSYGGQSGIARSSDGIDWKTVHKADNRGTYYNSLAAGGLGVVAIGQHQEDSYGPPFMLSKDGRTIVVDGETGRLTVTDDATGDVLTTIEMDVYLEEPPEQIQIDEDNGLITITDADGTVVMEFTEEEASAVEQETESDYEYTVPEPAVAFSPDGEEWFTVTTVGLDVAWAQSVAVGDGSVVIVGESGEFYVQLESGSGIEYSVELEGETTTGGVTTATTLAYPDESATFVWVGRPR